MVDVKILVTSCLSLPKNKQQENQNAKNSTKATLTRRWMAAPHIPADLRCPALHRSQSVKCESKRTRLVSNGRTECRGVDPQPELQHRRPQRARVAEMRRSQRQI